jgi:hypothetical protein
MILAQPKFSDSFVRERTHAAAALHGGKQKLGETFRVGERTWRQLLILGASAAVR